MDDKNANEDGRIAYSLGRLKNMLLAHMPEQGVFAAGIAGVGMARRDRGGFSEHRFDRPLVSLLVQGSKETVIGGNLYRLRSGQMLTVCLDMPSSSRILNASRDAPLLTFYFYLNPAMMRECLLEGGLGARSGKEAGAAVSWPDADFLEGMARLASLMDKPEQGAFRAELALRELHYLLLVNDYGRVVAAAYADAGPNMRGLFAAVTYLKVNLDRIVEAGELAKAANMSESTLYRHFKALTGMSPLRYHKQLRLHRARKLIMGGEQIAAAAYQVGYESVSQFSREYKKLFGVSPKAAKKALE